MSKLTAEAQPLTPYSPPSTSLRDALARRVFYDAAVRRYSRRSDRELGEMWGSPSFDDEKQAAYRLADDMLDTAQRWIDRTSDGKLSTARMLRMLVRGLREP